MDEPRPTERNTDDHDAPVLMVKGINISVAFVLECLANGFTPEEIAQKCPGFDPKSTSEVLRVAARQVATKEYSTESPQKKKDRWDKAAVILPFVGSAILAAVATLFTAAYQRSTQARDIAAKEAQNQIQKAQTVAPFMPYLTGSNEQAKQLAVKTISEIGGIPLAIEVVRSSPSQGTASALVAIAKTSQNPDDRSMARNAISQIFAPYINHAFLVRDQPEARGYGLYTYLLFGAAPNSEDRDRYLAAISVFLDKIKELDVSLGVGSKQSDLNISYVPIVLPPDKNPTPEWVLSYYDFARARSILSVYAPSATTGGPYILSTLFPASDVKTPQTKYAFANLSSMPPSVIGSLGKEFFTTVQTPRNWNAMKVEQVQKAVTDAVKAVSSMHFVP